MATGLGGGTVSGTGVSCTEAGGPDCDEAFAPGASVLLTATAGPGASFAGWGGDCPDTDATTPANQCRIAMSARRSVRARFDRATPVATLTAAEIADVETTRSGIGDFLAAHTDVDTVGEFLAALPVEYRRNWIFMPRSESLQTGVADSPRLMLVKTDGAVAFTIGFKEHRSFPAAHPNAVEFMQWDEAAKSFRFHDIALAPVPAMDDTDPATPGLQARFPARPRGVVIDDARCFACHSTRNVPNRGTTPGTDGVPAGAVAATMKPNWDAYDSWGGMLSFNRDRIYKGTVEAAAFRRLFNLWTWRARPDARRIVEQLELQPPGVPDGSPTLTRTHGQDTGGVIEAVADDRITRLDAGGPDDGHIAFGFDAPGAPTTIEPAPTGTGPAVSYAFNRRAGSAATTVARADPADPDPLAQYRQFVTLHRWTSPRSDVGRGVLFLDQISGNFNAQRIVRELINHRRATGDAPVDVRALTLAIAANCIDYAGGDDPSAMQTIVPALPPAAQTFFTARNGLSFDGVYDDTRRRQNSLPLRKADIQRLALDRANDPYVFDENGPLPPAAPETVNGLIQEYGAATAAGAGDTSLARLRQEVFRREIDRGGPDQTVMGGVIVDREDYRPEGSNRVALYRYLLEPLGVAVDKWSTSTRGRSRTYSFSASFVAYVDAFLSTEPGGLRDSLGIPEATSDVCPVVLPMVNAVYAALPAPEAIPTYTDVQRVFNKGCIECHGGLGYPPYRNYGDGINFAENETPAPGERRLWRSLDAARSLTGAPVCAPSSPSCPVGGGADPSSSYLYQRITDHGLLAHPYNPAEPYDAANPDNPADPDVADERCPEGLMPCGGPPLSKTDIETVRRWIVGGRPNTEGDPHIKTVEGVRYDFQAAGEFTLLRGEDMELQARQTPVTTAAPLPPDPHTGLSACVSVNTAVALKVGPNRVTYQPDLSALDATRMMSQQGRRLILRIDGKPVDVSSGPIALAAGGRVLKTAAPGGVEVQIPGGTSVVVTPGHWDAHDIDYMNIDVRHARAVEGVMGAIAPGGWLPALANGGQLGARPLDAASRYSALYKAFAESWRVTALTSQFDYEPGLGAGAFDVRRWPGETGACKAPAVPGGSTRTDPPAPIALEKAKALCAPLRDPDRRRNCTADVAATGEASFAEIYLLTEKIATAPQPPQPVLVAPADSAVVAAKGAEFSWKEGKSATGGALHHRLCLWRAGETYDFNKCAASSSKEASAMQKTPADILLEAAKKKGRALADKQLGRRTGAAASSRRVVERLEPGVVYYWKVVAEDENGAIVESRTRRLTIR